MRGWELGVRVALALSLGLLPACSAVTNFDRSKIPANDAGMDAGIDAGTDAGTDAGVDAGMDGGLDGGLDAGMDAGLDAGMDAGVDAGNPCDLVDCAGFDDGCNVGVCNRATGDCERMPREQGTECTDGDACTEDDVCDGAGTCAGVAVDCDDGVACTTDTCDEGTGACTHEVASGSCLIGGACVPDGTIDPDDDCQYCASGVAARAWSPRPPGSACDDGLFCTTKDVCGMDGACAGLPRDCDDGVTCTLDACDEDANACTHQTTAASCNIGGQCVADGARNPANDCEVCDPSRSPSAWSRRAAGATCDDGLFCTVGDQCTAAGTCAGAPRSCDDALTCTTDLCNETGDRCVHTLGAAQCLIGGVCYPNGASDPTNQCRRCNAAVDTTAFSPALVGTACDDGAFCTTGEACDSTGACSGGTPRLCGDGLVCTTDTCDEAANVCRSMLDPNRCLINGACFSGGASNPANVCQVCTPTVSTVAWSPQPAGAVCNDGNKCTKNDSCDGAGGCTMSAPRCDDGLSCTADMCDPATGACTAVLGGGTCLIANRCYNAGDSNPMNPCQQCIPSMSAAVWSPAPASTACDDGDACTVGDPCNGAGACGPGDPKCDDGLACTTDMCSAVDASCSVTIAPAACAIAGACYQSGGANPMNPCQSCQPTSSQTAWTGCPTGTACVTGVGCMSTP